MPGIFDSLRKYGSKESKNEIDAAIDRATGITDLPDGVALAKPPKKALPKRKTRDQRLKEALKRLGPY